MRVIGCGQAGLSGARREDDGVGALVLQETGVDRGGRGLAVEESAVRIEIRGYGHRIGKSIALAYVRKDLAAPGSKLEIEILGQRYPATVAQEPIYDPKNERLRA